MKPILIFGLSAVVSASGAVLFPADGTACKARPGTKVTLNASESMEVVCDGTYGWPGVELQPKDGTAWDFSGVGAIEVVVSNMSDRIEVFAVDVFPEGAKNRDGLPARSALVPPGETRLVSVQIADARVVTDAPVALSGTNGKVGCVTNLIDWSKTKMVEVFQCQPNNLHPLHFAVLSVRTAFDAVKPKVVPAAEFFPYCDRYGQFRHLDWPGKIHSDEELRESR